MSALLPLLVLVVVAGAARPAMSEEGGRRERGMADRAAPKHGSMPKGSAARKTKLGTPPSARGKLGEEPRRSGKLGDQSR